jgi:hypothetical protein
LTHFAAFYDLEVLLEHPLQQHKRLRLPEFFRQPFNPGRQFPRVPARRVHLQPQRFRFRLVVRLRGLESFFTLILSSPLTAAIL